jgi:hypothetical protein
MIDLGLVFKCLVGTTRKTIGQWSQRGRGDQFAEVSISSEIGQGRHTTGSSKFE